LLFIFRFRCSSVIWQTESKILCSQLICRYEHASGDSADVINPLDVFWVQLRNSFSPLPLQGVTLTLSWFSFNPKPRNIPHHERLHLLMILIIYGLIKIGILVPSRHCFPYTHNTALHCIGQIINSETY
jgi:hypothetical protein